MRTMISLRHLDSRFTDKQLDRIAQEELAKAATSVVDGKRLDRLSIPQLNRLQRKLQRQSENLRLESKRKSSDVFRVALAGFHRMCMEFS